MFFATVVTQCLAKFTTILDSRHKVPMNRETYTRAILPIGLFFSFSLICGNVAYLYLSVSFIQMLKVCENSASVRGMGSGNADFVLFSKKRHLM